MPHQVCHAHCPRGGGRGALVLLAIIAVVVASSAHRIEHAAEDVLEVAVIAVASVLGLAVLGTAAYVALRVHRSHARTRQALVSHTPIVQRGSQALSGVRHAVAEPGRVCPLPYAPGGEVPCVAAGRCMRPAACEPSSITSGEPHRVIDGVVISDEITERR
jgi:hypothetical protein